MTPEQLLNKFIIDALSRGKVHCQRIESSTGSGIPDINVRWMDQEFWIESKANPGPSAHIRPAQYAWMLRRARAGGLCFIIHRPVNGRKWWLYQMNEDTRPQGETKNYVNLHHVNAWSGISKIELNQALLSILDDL